MGSVMIKSRVCWGVWILCVDEVAVTDVGRGIVVDGITDYVRVRLSAGEDREPSMKPRAGSACVYLTEPWSVSKFVGWQNIQKGIDYIRATTKLHVFTTVQR